MEPIAIIGIGCRFPQADSPQAFWELLRTGKKAIRTIPTERWPVERFYHPDPQVTGKMSARKGGFIDNVDCFDASFFGISDAEAQHIDPQQRLFLEVAWEALENAGIAPLGLGGSSTGVFTGLCTIDYHRLLYKNYDCIGPHSGTGTTMSITANRLSYLLDLRGPSMAVDAACSSSLLSVHLACQSLRSQESNLCIVGGVNLILSPDSMISSSQTGLLSQKGECRPFDQQADGYVRGEGCGVVILQRLEDAIAENASILAVIKGSATNQDGLSNSLTAPNGLAQQALLQRALWASQVSPEDIDYVEAHAVGTPLGDAIEFKALQKVFGTGRAQPCTLGSVKPNIGHLEAASGIASLIKVVLSLHHEQIPPQLNFEQANQYVDLQKGQFEIRPEGKVWKSDKVTELARPRLAGISTFGFGGSNAHVIVSEAPPVAIAQKPSFALTSPIRLHSSVEDRTHHVMALSAKTPDALQALAQRYAQHLSNQPISTDLANICFTANTGRSHFAQRLCLVSHSVEQLQQQLTQFAEQGAIAKSDRTENSQAVPSSSQLIDGPITGTVRGRKKPKVVFHIPHPTSSTLQLGKTLYETQPTFRQTFDQCMQLIADEIDLPVSLIDETESAVPLAQVKGFAIAYSLCALWQSWGIHPKAVSGDGLGEYVAACLSGLLNVHEVLLGLASHHSEQAVPLTFYQPHIPLLSLIESAAQSHIQQQLATVFSEKRQSATSADLSHYSTLLTIGFLEQQLVTALPLETLYLQPSLEIWPQLLGQLSQLFVNGAPVDWRAFDGDYWRDRIPLPTYPFERSRHWFTPQPKAQPEFGQTQLIPRNTTQSSHKQSSYIHSA